MFTKTCKLNIVELFWISAAHRTDQLSFHRTAVVNMSWFIVIFIFFSTFFEPSWLHVELFNTKLDIWLYLQQNETFLI